MKVPAAMFSMVLFIAGCGVGSGDTTAGGGDGDGSNMGDGTVGLLCEATLLVSGALTPAGTPPGPDDGCVPEGTWTLNVTVDDPGDCETVNINSQYVYEITRDADEQLIMTYLGSDGTEEDNLKPAASGGTCRANIEHFSADLTEVVYLQPFEEELTITGTGIYELWE